jgi:hypothetical protein
MQQVLMKFNYTPANAYIQKVLHHLKICRTASLGYHVYQCSNDSCGTTKYRYHSCRNRHCPQCGALKKEEWIEARTQELLPVKYYHVVFTLPHELNSLVLGHRRVLYKLLFDASAQTLLSFAKDKQYIGATPGIISVLHTWGQQLSFHPHIHAIVSGAGITPENNLKEARKSIYSFLFPLKAISLVYKTKFLQALKQLITDNEVVPPGGADMEALFNLLYKKDWVIYAKAPFSGPQTVIEYLGRYTHKVAISNHRISSMNEEKQTVTFNYKDYADKGLQKQMTLTAHEFIRRFAQHILPAGFTKIRTYGYLSNRGRHTRINEVLKKMKLPVHKGLVKIPIQLRMMERFGIDIHHCPCCHQSTLQLLKVYYPTCKHIIKKKADDG